MPFQKQSEYFYPKMLSKWLGIGVFLSFFCFLSRETPAGCLLFFALAVHFLFPIEKTSPAGAYSP